MAFEYYFAGATTRRLESVLVKLGANILKSYYVDRSILLRWFKYKRQGWTGKLCIDNGEFSMHRSGGTINIDDYIWYLNDNDEYIDHAIALDKIPGTWGTIHTREEIDEASDITYKNFLYMREHCKSPDKLLPVYHQEERLDALERILSIDDLKYICISARKDKTPEIRKMFYDDCFNVIKRSNNPNIKVHCLGSGTISDVEMFPFTSTDSTSCNMVAANGNIFVNGVVLYVGDGCKSLLPAEKDIVYSICEQCNIIPEDLINYQDRAIINIHYMYNISKHTKCKVKRFGKSRLF